jgi:hypothetical protein
MADIRIPRIVEMPAVLEAARPIPRKNTPGALKAVEFSKRHFRMCAPNLSVTSHQQESALDVGIIAIKHEDYLKASRMTA